MHFEGEFRVPGQPEEVIRQFADVERMASCMPGAVIDGRAEDGSYHGGLLVSFGPKKIKFKGRVTCETDFSTCTGKIHGRGAADLRAARVSVNLAYSLKPDAHAGTPTTIVALVSDVELTGVLADFARTGGQVFATALMEDFSRRAVAEFTKDSAATQASDAAQPTPTQPAPLSVLRLLWTVIKGMLARLFARRTR
jgi:carbon monoxide dehydrogenase subunit G